VPQEATQVTILVSIRTYPLEVIYRVCYAFTDRYYLWLEPQTSGDIGVRITSKTGVLVPEHVQGEFGNALVDYAVRWSIAKETREVREVIVSAALAEAHKSLLK
jgi:His-Xaa-Ser system protein HxsD